MILIKKLTDTAMLPTRATKGSAGFDLYADEDTVIPPNHGSALVRTGIAVEIDLGKCGQIWPRSGMDTKNHVTRGAGLIDSDYRGEVKVLLINRGSQPFPVRRGHRIAQMIVTVAFDDEVVEVDALNKTERDTGGFGSSGT